MIDQLDSCEYLTLRSIEKPDENSVRLVLAEARSSDALMDPDIAGAAIGPVRQNLHDDTGRVFEVTWSNYISFAVTNESYQYPTETFSGQRIRRYTRSRFLGFVAHTTFASSDYQGPFEHVGVICLKHRVDVVSTETPQVRLLKPGKPRRMEGRDC